jgi:hypothetical protein
MTKLWLWRVNVEFVAEGEQEAKGAQYIVATRSDDFFAEWPATREALLVNWSKQKHTVKVASFTPIVLQPTAVEGMQPGMLHGPVGNFTTLDLSSAE